MCASFNDNIKVIAHIDDITCQTDLIEAIRAYNIKAERLQPLVV